MITDDSDNSDDNNKTPPPKKRKETKRNQKYRSGWEKTYTWLKQDAKNVHNAHCVICDHTFSIAKSGVGQVKQHGDTNIHIQKVKHTKKTSTFEHFFGGAVAGPSSASPDFLDDRAKITAGELSLTYHTVKHNLSYNSMDCNVKLNKVIYVDSKTALKIKLGRTKQEALVNEVLAPYALESVLESLRSPDIFYCVQTDASNKKNIKLFPLVVQYFDSENGVQNKLIDFYENANESADGMFQAINNSLTDHNLTFDRVSGLSGDNINANFGIHHSLFTNIKNLSPHLLKGNCHAHIIHNTVKHAMGILNCDVENIVLKIYSHFSSSACRREELKAFVAVLDGEWHELIRHVGTRWLSLLPCVDNILKNLDPLFDYFKNLEEDCPVHIENILLLNQPHGDIKIKVYLNFASHSLNNFNKAIKQLEGNNTTILDVYDILNTLKISLEQRQKDMFFGYQTKKFMEELEIKNLPESEKIKKNLLFFIEKSLNYLNKWFDFEESNWLCQIQKLNLKHCLNFDECDQIVKILHLEQRLNLDMDEMYDEIGTINTILENIQSNSDFTILRTDQKWVKILKGNGQGLPNLKKIVGFLLSVPATSAFTERIFSIMKLKWREERNRANLVLIKNELLIYTNLELSCEDSYQHFLKDSKLIRKAQSQSKYTFKVVDK
ncbi:uncharacterized protein LOC125236694 [Leguminivora glycinivorella]|uniref:uncharacterized protein LOC125236694 n=1 Tax=Leguminivora glycinivorella TaxID=1035111 RepID=UPI00200CF031|nr:uncharacterized protein LOC125236694 [Leguminivora glycinivorella]